MVRKLFHIQHGQAQQPLWLGNPSLVLAPVANAAECSFWILGQPIRHHHGKLG